ncbi:MAG: hypothetical protein ACI81W_003915, partial [Saprospiraceae bacterium]
MAGSRKSVVGSLIRTLQFNIWKFFVNKNSRLIKEKLPNIKLQETGTDCRLPTANFVLS